MVFCAQCQASLGRQGLKCGQCSKDRSPDPAYYCGAECQRLHWKSEHKAFHKKAKEIADEVGVLEMDYGDDWEAPAPDEDRMLWLASKAYEAMKRGDFRKSVKLSRSAIDLVPDGEKSLRVFTLYENMHKAYLRAGDPCGAIPTVLKWMELSDVGTECHRECGDKAWAQAATCVWACFLEDAKGKFNDLRPAWLTDTTLLKKVANRAVAADPPNLILALQFRAFVYAPVHGNGVTPPAADLRQAMNDWQRCIQLRQLPSNHVSDISTSRAAANETERLRGFVKGLKQRWCRRVLDDVLAIDDSEPSTGSAEEVRQVLRELRMVLADPFEDVLEDFDAAEKSSWIEMMEIVKEGAISIEKLLRDKIANDIAAAARKLALD